MSASGWALLPSTFGERLRMVRLHLEMDQSEIAELCGVKQAQWSRWELDMNAPSHFGLISAHIAAMTGCDLEWLRTGVIAEPPRTPHRRGRKKAATAGIEPATHGPILPVTRDFLGFMAGAAA
jgi:transcriptional regulator with XRE-family HTH domain